ncbi:hypothetical protein CLOBY_08110 [Clostridium saccharobutylicum]|uniref:hypothetical protein n=1 Tax=Clostridium saccharobutylicum TaxID=169679 RepID=UPI00098394CF|nr:hypothetical protein [Clostridium saccharobutylicum]AQS08701.1 hypothetical protein CLOBY_08110 [Clostridium saccharobutylicum]MBC2437226.1 hypothetical protein [Clostridium saccharobutylicum]NSB89609.1 hypothetical protein [Clostridium saccharobutylicum]NYC28953.1 hypothetical protein [Clostridium saccharobutylicum]OOM15039.1 hypothetical protein CLSAB_30410 [Clostridium saccharobutylicum]
MKLYEIDFKEGYRDIILKNHDDDIKYIKMLVNDYALKEQWPKIEIKVNHKGKKNDGPFFWSTIGALVISEKAKDELEEFWNNDDFELLPIYLEDEIYFIIHVINLQEIEFKIVRNKEDNVIKILNLKELQSKNMNEKGLFRIRLKNGKPYYPIFITEKFVELIKNSILKGFNFGVLWDSSVQEVNEVE